MSERVRDLLTYGIAAAKGKSKQEARFYLEWVLRAPDADQDQVTEAWRYLAEISDDPQEKRNCLEQVLASNPHDPEARRALAILNGELKPEEIVSPDRLPQPAAPLPPKPTEARRVVCLQCGGKMAFATDGKALTCAYCGRQQPLLSAMEENAMVEEQDFIIALATAKGHTQPTTMRAINCKGCGASFVLAPETISQNCPYCASAYVVEQAESRELIAPEAIVPFALTQDKALHAELDWFRSQGLALRSNPPPPAGVYLPAWTFDLSGTLKFSYMAYENKQWVYKTGSRAVFENDLLVPASHRLSATLADEIALMPLNGLVSYDPRYLADWPAETYEIAVGDASLVARSRVFDKEKDAISHTFFTRVTDFIVSSAGLVIESYKLILVPMWVTHYRMKGEKYGIVINGYTGSLRAEKPAKGVGKLLSSLFGAE